MGCVASRTTTAGQDVGKAGARGGNKTTEQPNNRILIRHRSIIDTLQKRNIGISVRLYSSYEYLYQNTQMGGRGIHRIYLVVVDYYVDGGS